MVSIVQVSTLVDMVNERFGTRVPGLAIMDCQLRWDDIILDVIRDGDVVEAHGMQGHGNAAPAKYGSSHNSGSQAASPNSGAVNSWRY